MQKNMSNSSADIKISQIAIRPLRSLDTIKFSIPCINKDGQMYSEKSSIVMPNSLSKSNGETWNTNIRTSKSTNKEKMSTLTSNSTSNKLKIKWRRECTFPLIFP